MSTIDIAYIEARIPEEVLIALFPDGEGSYDITKIENSIIDADAIVDNALSRVYVFPYEKENPATGNKAYSIIKSMKFIIAKKIIYSYKYDDEDMREVNADYNSVLDKLQLIIEGKEVLTGLKKLVSTTPLAIKVSTGKQIFTKQGLESYDN